MEYWERELSKNIEYFKKELKRKQERYPLIIVDTGVGFPSYEAGKINYLTDTKSECWGRSFHIDAHLKKEELVRRIKRIIHENKLKRKKNWGVIIWYFLEEFGGVVLEYPKEGHLIGNKIAKAVLWGNDFLYFECIKCGAIFGITEDGSDDPDDCPDCKSKKCKKVWG